MIRVCHGVRGVLWDCFGVVLFGMLSEELFFCCALYGDGPCISLSRILKLISSVSQVHGLSESFCHHDFVGQSDS